ncbi:hypothetical protein M8998_03435 [Sphingobacterium sp. lm-10]|uniref:hypothetical protein n=1 Tax=Sphingobacterium sp. lm-10 TaxID=2944904 RepID=UPI002020E332|nr:hypothetical protein [Sphingobacterium sp. lm-10]MCL7986990.1 hypothetical protein [Sphingobacterium sp. lm-10]
MMDYQIGTHLLSNKNGDMYKIVILTDSNRRYLEVLITNNLSDVLQHMSVLQQTQMNITTQLTRVVYEETYATENCAMDRLKELYAYTRMQRERLVRRQNPNWLNLHPVKPMCSMYNSTHYAS